MAATLESIIACPDCGFSRQEHMPTDACIWFWECQSCGVMLRPNTGDWCVYRSFGTVSCPSLQPSANGGCRHSTSE